MLPPVILVLAEALEKMLFVVLVVAEDAKPKMLLPAAVVVEARLLKGLIPTLVDAEDAPLELLVVKPNMPRVFAGPVSFVSSPFFPLEEKLNTAALTLVAKGTDT